jgi:hypothetical protein
MKIRRTVEDTVVRVISDRGYGKAALAARNMLTAIGITKEVHL